MKNIIITISLLSLLLLTGCSVINRSNLKSECKGTFESRKVHSVKSNAGFLQKSSETDPRDAVSVVYHYSEPNKDILTEMQCLLVKEVTLNPSDIFMMTIVFDRSKTVEHFLMDQDTSVLLLVTYSRVQGSAAFMANGAGYMPASNFLKNLKEGNKSRPVVKVGDLRSVTTEDNIDLTILSLEGEFVRPNALPKK